MYAVSILVGDVIQVLLPIPWLRGLDGHLHVVIDWRDPAVWRVLRLMVPVTLGLGLINFNAVVDSIFASRLIDPSSRRPRSTRRSASTCSRRGSSRSRSRPCCSRHCLALASRERRTAFAARSRSACARSRSCSSRRARSAPCSLSRSRGSSTSAASSMPSQTPVVAGALAAFSAGLVLQRSDAAAQPRVLQPAVELDPDRRRARQPRSERGARRGLLPLRDLGHPARDVGRQRRGKRDAAPAPAPRGSGGSSFGEIANSMLRIVVASAAGRRARTSTWVGLDRRTRARLSSASSSRSGPRSPSAQPSTSLACRALRVRELGALLALRRRLKAADS